MISKKTKTPPKCKGCGKLCKIYHNRRVAKFCSGLCYNNYQRNNAKQLYCTGTYRKCEQCKIKFYVPVNRKHSAKYCSLKCCNKAKALKLKERKCAVCFKSFYYKVGSKRGEVKKFCSATCRDNKGIGFKVGFIKVKCTYCRKVLIRTTSKVERVKKKGSKHFCNYKCNIRYQRSQSNVDGPNKAEVILGKLLKPYGFKFVGDGKFFLGAKNPDFVNKKTKTIVELFGEHWHKKEEAALRKREFKQYGYNTIIVWWKSLANLSKVQKQIRNSLSV